MTTPGDGSADGTPSGSPGDPDDVSPGPPAHLAHLPGMDLVARALEEARRGRRPGPLGGRPRADGSGTPRRALPTRRRWSGPGPDARDPQRLGAAASHVLRTRGWNGQVASASVFSRWPEIVGEQIAAHARPESLRERVLAVTAESTAWATQLRLVQSQILAKIAEAVGDGVVTSLRITGPTAPSWRKGRRHVSGRGPRDTYG